MPGPYLGLTRSQASAAVRVSLVEQSLFQGVEDKAEDVLISKFGDVVTLRDNRRVIREDGEVNLRKPILVVSCGETNVSLSANCNMDACDNKVVCEVGGRTGGFCTACTADEKQMHGERASEPYLMNMGADRAWAHFRQLVDRLGGIEEETLEEVVIPSGRGDYARRLGTKHAPLTTQLDYSKVVILTPVVYL